MFVSSVTMESVFSLDHFSAIAADLIERWWSAQGRSSPEGREKESCSVTSVVWQATEGTMVLGTLL